MYVTNVDHSLVPLECSLFISIDHDFLVNNQTLALAHILNQNLSWILRQNISDAVIFELLLSERNEEGVLFVDEETIEDQLGVGHALALQTHALVEVKRGHQRDQQIHQKVVGAILALLRDHFASTLVNQVVDDAVVFGIGHERAQVHSLSNPRLRIQKGLPA